MFVYAITNHKGGVGKTTTTVNLGAALRQNGKRVLLIDLDPKASMTAAVGQTAHDCSIGDALLKPTRILRAMQPCAQGMTLVPAAATLTVDLLDLADSVESMFRLQQALQIVKERFDYALIDCPSTLGCAMTNALTASDVALVPLQCDFLSLRGLADIQEITAAIRDTVNPDLRLRAVGTMFDRRTTHSTDVLREARIALPGLVYNTTIPRNVRLAEAPATGQTILEYAPHSTGAEAYCALAQEIIQEESVYGTTRRDQSSDAEAALLLQTA